MKGLGIVLFMLILSVSCSEVDLTSTKYYEEGRVFPTDDSGGHSGSGHVGEGDKPVIPDPEFYHLCAEYPDGYDWVRDPQYGIVDCSLVVMKDKNRLASRPAGYKYGIFADSDMVWLEEMNLYSQSVESGQTVVRKDGEELLRFDGEEMLTGFLDYGGVLYTSSVPKDGGGWIYRCDGKSLAVSAKGQPSGPLYEDDGYVLFPTFMLDSDFAAVPEYSLVKNGVSARIDAVTGAKLVDYREFNGTRYILSTFYDNRPPVLVSGSGTEYLSWPEAQRIESRGLFAGEDGHLYVLGAAYKAHSKAVYVLWRGTSPIMSFPPEMDVKTCISVGSRVVAIGYRRSRENNIVIYDKGKLIDIPSGYKMPDRNCISAAQGHYLICFNPVSPDEQPLAAEDGLVRNIDVRGCVLSVSCKVFGDGANE